MEIIHHIQDIRTRIRVFRRQPARTIGFVPTMGFLHEGHLALIDRSVSENNLTVVSIFVNPTQFGPNEDFDAYPRDLDRDIRLCRSRGAGIVFTPAAAEIYPPEHATVVSVKTLTEPLCGASRPGHFDGVTTVVLKLFNIVSPDRAYFGQKDGQQAAVVQRMTTDLNLDVDVRILPTVREFNGLARSSRNAYLSASGRQRAGIIYQALSHATTLFQEGERHAERLRESAETVLASDKNVRVQYLECRYLDTMENVTGRIERRAMLAFAGYLEGVRLIDNVVLDPGSEVITS